MRNATDILNQPANNTALTPLNTALLLTCLIPVVVSSGVGNGLVVYAVYRYHRLRTPTYLIIASLAVADFFTGLIGIPVYLYFSLSRNTTCDPFVGSVLTAPLMVFSAVSFTLIIIISVDRYIAITRPLRYASIVTTKRVRSILFGIELLQISDYHQPVLAQVSIISVGINSAVNPLIYAYKDRLFREAFSDLKSRLVTLIL
ncbi:beta-2 adrenergic receptor-like [Diadema antillarum]|uniref:beta-2 adrenergic receptor-like n=1 Tax=Diadema antillarum TaxID=105358 RepID=UPI003A8C594E